MTKKKVAQRISGSCSALITVAEEAAEAGHEELYNTLESQVEDTIRQLKIHLRNLRLDNRGLEHLIERRD